MLWCVDALVHLQLLRKPAKCLSDILAGNDHYLNVSVTFQTRSVIDRRGVALDRHAYCVRHHDRVHHRFGYGPQAIQCVFTQPRKYDGCAGV